jgi:hypothetical protein
MSIDEDRRINTESRVRTNSEKCNQIESSVTSIGNEDKVEIAQC